MCVVAHPDDECFAFGGALLLAADRGIETYILCLTDGQAATHRGDAASGDALGAMRRAEFAASCEVLGAAKHELMDYQDAQLEFVDFSEAAGRLVEKIRSYKPDVVLTWAGDGGLNTHPDHMMVSTLTTSAFHWAGRAKRYPEAGEAYAAQRLYHLSTNFFMPDRQAPMPMPWSVRLDVSAVRERKAEAFRQHISQAPLMERTRGIFEEHGAEEFYTLVAAADPQPCRMTSDLFEGLQTS